MWRLHGLGKKVFRTLENNIKKMYKKSFYHDLLNF